MKKNRQAGLVFGGWIFPLLIKASYLTAAPLVIDEKKIIELATQQHATHYRLEAAKSQADLSLARLDEQYQTELLGNATLSRTNKTSFHPYAPVITPNKNWDVRVNRKMAMGATVYAGVFGDQLSTLDNSIEDFTSSGIRMGFRLDLWRNLFGKLDSAQIEDVRHQKQMAEMRSEIDKRNFELNVRKLYWSIIATKAQIDVTKILLNTAIQQLDESKRRFAANIAERGEVARYQAQVIGRETMIKSLDFQKQKLILELKQALPQVKGHDLRFISIPVTEAVTKVLTCTQEIQNQRKVPWEQTKYDDLVSYLEKSLAVQQKVNDSHAKANLALKTDFEYAGVGEKYKGAYEEISDEGKYTYAVGLELQMPLGGKATATERLMKKVAMEKVAADKSEFMAMVQSRYEQMAPMVKLLQEGILLNNQRSEYLEQTITETRKQYEQARVSVDAIVNDQTALLNTQLDTIQSRLAIVHELMDYFRIFNDSPCPLNKLK